MRALKLLVVATAALLAGPSLAQGWIEYANLEDRFVVNFPAEPEITETTYLSDYRANLPARIYAVNQGASRYSVTVVDYTETERLLAERSERTGERLRPDDVPGDVMGSVAFAAWNIRKRGGELTYDSWAHNNRIPGHQLQLTNADQSRTYAGIFRYARRLYIVEAMVPAGLPPPGLFQQSLTILDGDGWRVRYNWEIDEQGEIHRVRAERRERWSGDPPVMTSIDR